ncbi:HPF/RaiA family ribosome-associated protein [Aquabacterium sp. A7-Y]|uniref:HPF/RaiA family ribosome-associated protein n=1 Tax=Aquabacterium sp. A7-Y TaxID=1349605 RepID=UPI00223D4204|nr:HPF/RaiA family ribosome-associated protein [Aquabacterium sp. A7-Y]MCW7541131.1 HPF/RaiA family ribosome-associated protein [Aquabacterium sp. A7-Y]
MDLPLDITFDGVEPRPALLTVAQEKANKLVRRHEELVHCRVVLQQLPACPGGSKPFGVCIDATLPGYHVTVNDVRNDDPYLALRDAFVDMGRELHGLSVLRPTSSCPGWGA